MVSVPRRTHADGFPVAPGDRLIVDASVGEAVCATMSGEALAIVDARS
jgi:hypothetical protein